EVVRADLLLLPRHLLRHAVLRVDAAAGLGRHVLPRRHGAAARLARGHRGVHPAGGVHPAPRAGRGAGGAGARRASAGARGVTPASRGGPGGSGTLPTVRLYETSGCHLCRVARSLLTALQRTIPFHLEAVSIEGD